MGQVYRARDTRLERPVAIKVLHGTANEHRDRLTREARVIAALQHPHICTLYDVGSHDGADYLVMEHVEGTTLRGPLPLDKVIDYGVQIADALDAAHQKGITHRDLKPGNIMLTRTGVKVLDFGIAQMTGLDSLTQTARVAGTPAYMAPEQWTGGPTDARTDIYALGRVLAELSTGRNDPDQPLTPPAFAAIVRRCLEKNPDDRWQSARDVKYLLASLRESAAAVAPPRPATSRLAAALVPLALAVGALAAWELLKPAPAEPLHASIAPPPGSSFLVGRNYEGGIALSPDGKTLAFVASTEGRAQLWVRRLTSAEARPIPGTDGAFLPFWSPDSTQIAFYTADRLKRVGVESGAVQEIVATDPRANGGAWLAGDVLLISARPGGGIHRIPVAGGESTQIAMGAWPSALPDGKRFLFMTQDGVSIASIDAPDQARPIPGLPRVRAMYAQGHLIYARDHTLVAQAFNPDQATVTGEPIPIASPLYLLPLASRQASFSVGPDGMLIYASGDPLTRVRWRSRNGAVLGDLGAPAQYLTPRISPDGARIAYAKFEGGSSAIWISPSNQPDATRLTFENTVVRHPIWSPDGEAITYSSGTFEAVELFRKAADGTGVAEQLTASPSQQHSMDWSADGQVLLITRNDIVRGTAILALPMSGDRTPYVLLDSPVSEAHSQFNPNGPPRWIVYSSDDTGRREIYVAPFVPGKPFSGERRQVSTDGGTMPRWRRDGREIYYWALDGRMMAVPVDGAGTAFIASPAQTLFQVHRPTMRTNDIEFDVNSDGSRFLLVEPSEATTFQSLSLVTNWRAGRN
jgi:Tol biopolymer transport system component